MDINRKVMVVFCCVMAIMGLGLFVKLYYVFSECMNGIYFGFGSKCY